MLGNENDDDFVFDNQMIVQAVAFGFRIAEVTCPTKYFDDASSISLKAAAELRLKRMGVIDPSDLRTDGRKLPAAEPIDD